LSKLKLENGYSVLTYRITERATYYQCRQTFDLEGV